MLVPVTVTNAGGAVIADLHGNNFRLGKERQPQEIISSMFARNGETDVELRFELRPVGRVLVEARLRSEAFSREFRSSAAKTELFVWLAEEIHKRVTVAADKPQLATPTEA